MQENGDLAILFEERPPKFKTGLRLNLNWWKI